MHESIKPGQISCSFDVLDFCHAFMYDKLIFLMSSTEAYSRPLVVHLYFWVVVSHCIEKDPNIF
jgi:hypothetical protein